MYLIPFETFLCFDLHNHPLAVSSTTKLCANEKFFFGQFYLLFAEVFEATYLLCFEEHCTSILYFLPVIHDSLCIEQVLPQLFLFQATVDYSI